MRAEMNNQLAMARLFAAYVLKHMRFKIGFVCGQLVSLVITGLAYGGQWPAAMMVICALLLAHILTPDPSGKEA